MTERELAKLIADEINSKTSTVVASVSHNGKLVLTAKQSGTKTGLTTASISDGTTGICSVSFSGGNSENKVVLIGNEGDTYFQRWDGVKTIPRSEDDTNQVIEVASVMLESHINLDGRYDIDRGSSKLASIDWSNFGVVNDVYTQGNNFFSGTDYDESLNLDTYPASITWTQQKSSNADIDEWTHITLASSLALDGEKGTVQALRRFRNSIVAFQDKGISEILFNSRTQVSTQEGVPVEIANSGKVDGKRYLSNKYGVTNKWSITEGKSGLFFVDNINKAFCSYDGSAVTNLSEKLGFGAWFRRNNVTDSWRPSEFNNIVSFYDKIHSDVYLVKHDSTTDEAPSLVYNELLGTFTSFYDYGSVPMIVNVNDRFISYKNRALWLQNEGLYCNFFGTQYDFWVNYRVTPEPYGDKIWTNLEYRSDAYRLLDSTGNMTVSERDLIDGGDIDGVSGNYQKDETFNQIKVWNEYQQTANIAVNPIKKFRIWRFAIPRAIKTDTNKFGLDRIHNPWINLQFKKTYTDKSENTDMMQLHDITVKYFE